MLLEAVAYGLIAKKKETKCRNLGSRQEKRNHKLRREEARRKERRD